MFFLLTNKTGKLTQKQGNKINLDHMWDIQDQKGMAVILKVNWIVQGQDFKL